MPLHARYCSSLTCSIQSTVFPSSCSWMAMCVMAVVGAAPCQCFSPGGNQMTSPGRISSTGPPQRCARPQPAVTIRVWPSGWVCHAVRAPGSNVTLAPCARAGSCAWNRGSMRTVPVKYSAGPLPDGCEPLLLMSTCSILHPGVADHARGPAMPASSAVHLRHLLLVVPGPGHLVRAQGRVECRQVRGGERHGYRADVLLDMAPPLAAGNRHDVRALVQQPGERDLTRRHALLRGQLAHRR